MTEAGGDSRDGHAATSLKVFDVISGQWLLLLRMAASHYDHDVCATAW